MLSKKLEATVDIKNIDAILSEDLQKLSLEYYITESDITDEEQNYHRKIYGVEIVKREFKINSDICTEKKLINDISCCKETAKEVVDKLIAHTVTPVTLSNVLEDLIGMI